MRTGIPNHHRKPGPLAAVLATSFLQIANFRRRQRSSKLRPAKPSVGDRQRPRRDTASKIEGART
jgi:hypothetical protein